ncbi:MAG: hypothetical protein BGO98_35465 [Myxococcales bacterium 68-20]|nr:MAG: hypothetical protein BGO98_35465 [Myxococcales bacterium 68-20]
MPAPSVVTSDVAHGGDVQTIGNGAASTEPASRMLGASMPESFDALATSAAASIESGPEPSPSLLEQLAAAPPDAKKETATRMGEAL